MPLFTRVPFVGPEQLPQLVFVDAGFRFPSTSVSFDATSTVTGISTGVVALSAFATGASLTASTVIVTVAVLLNAPSSSLTA